MSDRRMPDKLHERILQLIALREMGVALPTHDMPTAWGAPPVAMAVYFKAEPEINHSNEEVYDQTVVVLTFRVHRKHTAVLKYKQWSLPLNQPNTGYRVQREHGCAQVMFFLERKEVNPYTF